MPLGFSFAYFHAPPVNGFGLCATLTEALRLLNLRGPKRGSFCRRVG